MTGEVDPLVQAGSDILHALQKAGVFEVKHGKVTINFHDGIVHSIVVEERRYQHIAPRKGLNIPI